jgi:hypothetical protein
MEWLAFVPSAHRRSAIAYRASKKKGAGALIRLPIQRASDSEVSGAQGLTAGGVAAGPSWPLFVSSPADESGIQAIRYFGGETPDASYPETLICGR